MEVDGETKINNTVTVHDISEYTSIVAEDVASSLTQMGILKKSKTGALNASKEDVRNWVNRTRTNLEPPLDIDFFIVVQDDDTTDASSLEDRTSNEQSDVDMTND